MLLRASAGVGSASGPAFRIRLALLATGLIADLMEEWAVISAASPVATAFSEVMLHSSVALCIDLATRPCH